MARSKSFILRVAVMCLLMLVSGCARISRENYEKIETGMTLSQVESILGMGTEESGAGGAIGDIGASAKVVRWGDENRSITVTFVNNQVVAKAQQGL
jgi:hypothetical protein